MFGVPVTTLQQEYLVTSWLGGSGGVEEATPDPYAQSLTGTGDLPRDESRDLGVLDGPENPAEEEAGFARATEGTPTGEASTSTTRTGEGFLLTSLPTETGAVSLSSLRTERVVMPELEIPARPNLTERIGFKQAVGEGSPAGQWADYVVARAMNDQRDGIRPQAARYGKEVGLDVGLWGEIDFIRGVLKGAGMSIIGTASFEEMRAFLGEVEARLTAGEPLGLTQLAHSVLPNNNRSPWRVLGWITGAGLLHPVPGGARQRMKEYAVGLGRQAQADGQVPDVPSIARAVFGVPVATLQQEYLVSSWLGVSGRGEEATPDPDAESLMDTSESPRGDSPDLGRLVRPGALTAEEEAAFVRQMESAFEGEAASVSTSRDEGVVAPELVVPDPPSATETHLSIDDAAREDSPVGRWADYVVARAMNDRRNSLPMVLSTYRTELGLFENENRTTFVVGVLEAAGVLASQPMRPGATYEQMRSALDLIGARLAEGMPFHPRLVAREVGLIDLRRGQWRVLGWVTGSMLLHSVPGGARQQMKDHAVRLGRQAQVKGQVPDVRSIARAVFGVPVTTLQQEYLVTSWLGG
ncbi:hypothetical protein, partial [Streptomyces viridochromogenes]